MSQSFATDLGTRQPYIPVVGYANQGKLPGPKHYISLIDQRAGVVVEQSNVTAGYPIWANSIPITNGSEPGVIHVWDAAAAHARKIWIGSQFSYTLASDTSSVLFATGVPSSGTGSDGDLSYDGTTGTIYLRASGAWAKYATVFLMPHDPGTINTDTTLTRAAHANRPINYLGGALAVDTSFTLLDGLFIFNASGTPMAPSFLTATTGFKSTFAPNEEAQLLFDGTAWRSQNVDVAGICAALIAASGGGTTTPTGKRKIVITTDFDTDSDDFTAISMMLMAHHLGWIQIVGIAVNSAAPNAPAAVDALCRWFGFAIPIAVWKGTARDSTDSTYVTLLSNRYSHVAGASSTVPDAVPAMRSWLAASADQGIEIVSIGYMVIQAALLASAADSSSSLAGMALVTAKVKGMWVMGGQYPSGAEFNFTGGGSTADGDYKTATATTVNTWPTPMSFVGYEAGNFQVASGSASVPTTDIRWQALAGGTSSAFDPIAALVMLDDVTGVSWTQGTNAVDGSTGANAFTAASGGAHRYVTRTQTNTWFDDRVSAFIKAQPDLTVPTLSWGTSTPITPIRPGAAVVRAAKTEPAGQLLANGTFANTNGWVAVRSVMFAKNGRLSFFPAAGQSYEAVYTAFTTVSSANYAVTVVVESTTNTGRLMQITVKNGVDDTAPDIRTVEATYNPGTYSFVFTAASTQTVLFLIYQGEIESASVIAA